MTFPTYPNYPNHPTQSSKLKRSSPSCRTHPRYKPTKPTTYPPHYSPVDDSRRYDQVEFYYNTGYHELTHSTGHPKRLNRFTHAEIPNIHDYGIEELVAGMGSAMLADLAGSGHTTLQPDASHIQHWNQTIKANRGTIRSAAQRSQKAVDYIMNREPEFAASDDGEKSP